MSEYTIKKSCHGCKAYSGISFACELQFKKYRDTPKEPCPKPVTNDALIEIQERKRKH